jgi:hypothetical protein
MYLYNDCEYCIPTYSVLFNEGIMRYVKIAKSVMPANYFIVKNKSIFEIYSLLQPTQYYSIGIVPLEQLHIFKYLHSTAFAVVICL